MSIKAVFFDLDGTLLPLIEDEFIYVYFSLLSQKMVSLGYEKETFKKVMIEGIKRMYQNDGTKTNEEVFWNVFENFYGSEKLSDKKYLDEFYNNEFKEIKKCCKENPYARKIIDFCHNQGIRVFLTTNPFFPKIATLTRMGFVNLKENDFEYITTYENSSYVKPNPNYFKEVLNKFALKPDEVILFGNNTLEDGECSLAVGIKCYMVGNYLINPSTTKHKFEHIKLNEVIDVIKKNLM